MAFPSLESSLEVVRTAQWAVWHSLRLVGLLILLCLVVGGLSELKNQLWPQGKSKQDDGRKGDTGEKAGQKGARKTRLGLNKIGRDARHDEEPVYPSAHKDSNGVTDVFGAGGAASNENGDRDNGELPKPGLRRQNSVGNNGLKFSKGRNLNLRKKFGRAVRKQITVGKFGSLLKKEAHASRVRSDSEDSDSNEVGSIPRNDLGVVNDDGQMNGLAGSRKEDGEGAFANGGQNFLGKGKDLGGIRQSKRSASLASILFYSLVTALVLFMSLSAFLANSCLLSDPAALKILESSPAGFSRVRFCTNVAKSFNIEHLHHVPHRQLFCRRCFFFNPLFQGAKRMESLMCVFGLWAGSSPRGPNEGNNDTKLDEVVFENVNTWVDASVNVAEHVFSVLQELPTHFRSIEWPNLGLLLNRAASQEGPEKEQVDRHGRAEPFRTSREGRIISSLLEVRSFDKTIVLFILLCVALLAISIFPGSRRSQVPKQEGKEGPLQGGALGEKNENENKNENGVLPLNANEVRRGNPFVEEFNASPAEDETSADDFTSSANRKDQLANILGSIDEEDDTSGMHWSGLSKKVSTDLLVASSSQSRGPFQVAVPPSVLPSRKVGSRLRNFNTGSTDASLDSRPLSTASSDIHSNASNELFYIKRKEEEDERMADVEERSAELLNRVAQSLDVAIDAECLDAVRASIESVRIALRKRRKLFDLRRDEEAS